MSHLFCCSIARTYRCRLRLQHHPDLEEQAKAKWADVQNKYQRRADLIPNLVATVKGYAEQEKDVLTAVVEARAKATQIKVDASQLTDPEKFKQFQDAQNQLSRRARPADRDQRELSGPQVEPELPGAAVAARRHREPHRGRAARLHRGGARLQHRARTFPGVLWARRSSAATSRWRSSPPARAPQSRRK